MFGLSSPDFVCNIMYLHIYSAITLHKSQMLNPLLKFGALSTTFC